MRYLIVQDWSSTHGNHAGMVHMCKLLCESYPNDYEVIIKPIPTDYSIRKYGIFGKLLNRFYYSLKRKNYIYVFIIKPLRLMMEGLQKYVFIFW